MSPGGFGARRVVIVSAIVLMVVSLGGIVVSLVANAFFLDDYNAYGEVPVPGEATMHLPAGDVTISFHTQVIGTTNGGGLPIPDLGLTIVPPAGVADPPVAENIGGTTTVNGDAHRRVWVTHIARAGEYTIKADGKVSAFISPRLAFGHGSSLGSLPWIFGGVFGVGLLALLAAILLTARAPRRIPPLPSEPYTPTDEGVKLQQLNTLASLHSSGALTDQEFEAEKRRVLGS
ncbi:SHOCT domain-containing protein [Mycobacterium sp.]|uniref:SHOCT domain-containing protein n=1 Tax=Mycobacterium sp. TaxID=1785 RepID=UPI002CD6B040|nr:SHOCT domain-containing protein [Mycobacterium sp.]HME48584.1 SHOCT domain-containing protein [Mycobacterium sp.]